MQQQNHPGNPQHPSDAQQFTNISIPGHGQLVLKLAQHRD
jgi:hypothetical protein